MVTINKYSCILIIIYMYIVGSLKISIIYTITHFSAFVYNLIIYCIMFTIIYYLMYKIIIKYKQYILPMILIGINYIDLCMFLTAKIWFMQYFGLAIIFGVIIYELIREVKIIDEY